MGNDALDVAKRFASALDDEDYKVLAVLLAEDCLYQSSRGPLLGPAAVVDSYREAGSWTKANIQHVRYESTVRPDSDDTAFVAFFDHLEHQGRRHTYNCEQHVTIDVHGRICGIVHIELPGQREGAEAFLQSIGVRRDRTLTNPRT